MAVQPAERMLIFSGERKIGSRKRLSMIGCNSEALDPKIRSKLPVGVGFTFEFGDREVSSNGLPKDKPRDKAFDRCDAIIEILSRIGLDGIHAGDAFFDQRVRHQFQLKAERELDRVRREIIEKFDQVRIDKDTGWSFVTSILEPNAVEREYAENRDTLTRIENSGVKPGSTRLIDFQFAGAKKGLQQLSELLAQNGYAAEFSKAELIARKAVSLDWWTFAANCADLRGVAQEFGCTFEGWGHLSD